MKPQARVEAGQARVAAVQASLWRSATPVRQSLQAHPARWLLGGGFAAGLLAGLIAPGRRWVQTGFSIATGGIKLLGPLLAAIAAEAEIAAPTPAAQGDAVSEE